MNTTPKTIQIYLPGGDPRGIRFAEITTRIVRVIEVPRSLLSEFLAMPESGQVGVYFLVGDSDDESKPKVYIGQTGDLRARLATHNQDREFWQKAIVLNSLTRNLTQTHTLFLEWHCIQMVRRAGRYAEENGNGGSKPYTPAPLEADCHEIFETAETLLATLGYPLFTPIVGRVAEIEGDEVFRTSASEADGRGLYTEEGFVVLSGSSGRKTLVESSKGTSLERLRERLKSAGVLREEGDRLLFTRDYLFDSPSSAAMVLLGRTANGWETWKSRDDRTLHELKRQPLLSAGNE